MNYNKFIGIITEREGQKSIVKRCDVMEIVGIISDLVYGEGKKGLIILKNKKIHSSICVFLYRNGKRRAEKKGKK